MQDVLGRMVTMNCHIKGIYLCLVTLLFSISSMAQGIDNIWTMGYNGGNFFYGPMNLNFSSGSLVIDTVDRDMSIGTTNGEICDSGGNLLFYSNGVYIANSLNDTMLNGYGLNPSYYTTQYSQYGLLIPQANLILKVPGSSTKYYLFHETVYPPQPYETYYLFSSTVDMSLDGGLGAVIQKNNVVFQDTLVGGRITACKHANGRDWWLFVPKLYTGKIFKFLVTPAGISGPTIEDLLLPRLNVVGQFVFSPQGTKFAYYDPESDLSIGDFDRCTGTMSNVIHFSINDSATAGGLAFSPNERYLYVSSDKYIYQYDMDSLSNPDPKITVGIYDGTLSQSARANFYLAALAPDQKIYISCPNSTFYLHVINFPDSNGISCGFCQHCITLPKKNLFTVPNHPNYFLGPISSTICDSLTSNIEDATHSEKEISLFPNPAKDFLTLTNINEQIVSIEIANQFGVVVEKDLDFSVLNSGLKININFLKSGIYFLRMKSKSRTLIFKFLKQ